MNDSILSLGIKTYYDSNKLEVNDICHQKDPQIVEATISSHLKKLCIVVSVSIDIDECFFLFLYKQYTINEEFVSILTLLADLHI